MFARNKTKSAEISESDGSGLERAIDLCSSVVQQRVEPAVAERTPRRDLAAEIRRLALDTVAEAGIDLNRLEQRELVTTLMNGLVGEIPANDKTAAAGETPPANGAPADNGVMAAPPPVSAEPATAPPPQQTPPDAPSTALVDTDGISTALDELNAGIEDFNRTLMDQATTMVATPIYEAKARVQPVLLERIDISAATEMSRSDLARQVTEIVSEILLEERLRLNLTEQRDLVTMLINDMLGLGPLEPLLSDDSITDIMVNGANQVYIEKKGKLELSDVRFRDNAHVMNIATRIVSTIGRRIDESQPLVDARLVDGSRVNIIIPPLAIDGPSISIRKFSKKGITLDIMAQQGNISKEMATVLKIASRSRLNLLISGGTGSGKTTLLNALSQLIDHGERICTIEDAAELQLQQPHVVRLETRTANLEGDGEITMRDLLKNTLRMRPDRIILGEVRGHEAVDMLQAMNTGHDGSMCTVHANRPREAMTRLENMIGMAGINLPSNTSEH